MGKELENFVRFSVRYQLLLARHVADICNMKVYIFDGTGYFKSDESRAEVIDGINTLFKCGNRAVLSVAVQESFGSNEDLFLEYVDDSITKKDDIGLYVEKNENPCVEEVKEEKKKEENGEESELSEKFENIL
jgi:hypothetical protein